MKDEESAVFAGKNLNSKTCQRKTEWRHPP